MEEIADWRKTTDYKVEQGKKLLGTGVLLFANGLIWFVDHPNPIFFRAEIVIGVTLAAYGMLK